MGAGKTVESTARLSVPGRSGHPLKSATVRRTRCAETSQKSKVNKNAAATRAQHPRDAGSAQPDIRCILQHMCRAPGASRCMSGERRSLWMPHCHRVVETIATAYAARRQSREPFSAGRACRAQYGTPRVWVVRRPCTHLRRTGRGSTALVDAGKLSSKQFQENS